MSNQTFSFDNDFFDVLNTSIGFIGKLFTKVFNLEEKFEKTLMKSIRTNHIKNYNTYKEF